MSQKCGAYAYVECSAKNKENIKEVFTVAGRVSMQKAAGGCCVLM
jgi:hypothetical protein